MSISSPARTQRKRETLPLRVLVLAPALATVFAVLLATLRTDEVPTAANRRELRPAATARELPEPQFGSPLANVYSAGDAIDIPRGWVVLDTRGDQLAFLSDSGTLETRVGGRGPGPGELLRPAKIALMDSSIVVADATGTRLDFFSLEGVYQRRIRLESPGCGAAPVRDLDSGRGHVVMLRLCMRASGRTSALLERIGPTGERTVLTERRYSDLTGGAVNPSWIPLLAVAQDRVYFVITPDPCVRDVTGSPEASFALCHPDDRPVALSDSARETFRALAPRFDSLGADLIVPERYPPFEDIMEAGGRLAFYTVLDDRARALDLVRGDELERLTLPVGPKVFAGTRGLLFARDDVEGTAFAVVPFP